MITREDFFMGRDKKYASELTPEIEANAQVTIDRANRLLTYYYDANPDANRCKVNSGWRPAAVNAATKGAAPRSKHMLGQAVDLSDDGSLYQWCEENLPMLEMIGLWMENRRDSPTWTHWQTVAPGSGNRIFYAR
jgi:hypothetical protein